VLREIKVVIHHLGVVGRQLHKFALREESAFQRESSFRNLQQDIHLHEALGCVCQ